MTSPKTRCERFGLVRQTTGSVPPIDRSRSKAQRVQRRLCHLSVRYMEASRNGGIPIAGWFTRENPIKTDELGVPLF